jgi:hypothetical protein
MASRQDRSWGCARAPSGRPEVLGTSAWPVRPAWFQTDCFHTERIGVLDGARFSHPPIHPEERHKGQNPYEDWCSQPEEETPWR